MIYVNAQISDFLIQSSVSVVVKNCTINSVVKTKTRSYLARLKDNRLAYIHIDFKVNSVKLHLGSAYF